MTHDPGSVSSLRRNLPKNERQPAGRSRIGSFWHSRIILAVLTVLLTSACQRDPAPAQVSEKPGAIQDGKALREQPGISRFGLRARVSYEDIEAIAADQLPASYPVVGERQVCKRIIGIKACGTAQWDLLIERTAALQLSGVQGLITASAPLRFSGMVGIRGAAAQALGLSSLRVSGALVSTINTTLMMQADWCPQLRVDASYRWTEKPTALWRGKLDMDLENIVNDALNKQLAALEPRINDSIDCGRFRQQLTEHWRSYSFPLEIPSPADDTNATPTPGPQQVHLNIVPTGFAFSGIQTEADKLGIGFELEGTTVVASEALHPEDLDLPPLRKVDFQASRTEFNLLLRADYQQLAAVISPLVLDKTFTSDSAAGRVSVTLTQIALSGNRDGVTVALEFIAQLPGTRKNTRGELYLTATPMVDPDREQLQLQNIRLSRLLDSTLWNLVSTVFEGQIIAAIERAATLDLSTHTHRLEQALLLQLQDPARTGDLNIRADKLDIRLLGIHAEADALVARTRVSAELDIDIPLTVLKKPLK
ncbi:DUF4403 family protein [Granulosicoccus sp. 3-233]|uniref:DUF4403 family protein n=1 Tax=Granulosicoccus sp. 3-233 TaxID=3417969 RepID=UPI003D32570B